MPNPLCGMFTFRSGDLRNRCHIATSRHRGTLLTTARVSLSATMVGCCWCRGCLCIGRRICQRARKQAAIRLCGALLVSFHSTDSKTRGAVDPCRLQIVKGNLSAYFGEPIFLGGLFAPTNAPRPVQHGGGVELAPLLHSIRTAVSASRES